MSMGAVPEQVGVVIPAAGQGAQLDGRPLLAWAVAAMEANRSVVAIVVVVPPKVLDPAAKLLADQGFAKVSAVVPGGATRGGSVAAGLAALPPGPGFVAIHDAARPLADHGLVDRLLEMLLATTAAPAYAGVAPAVAVTDTVRRVDGGGRSGGVVDRAALRALQTPQLFRRVVLEAACQGALQDGFETADEAALVERAGHAVALITGSVENLKVTSTLDLLVAEALLAQRMRRDA